MVIDREVQPVWVVEALAAGEDREASLRPVSERFLLDQLALEHRKEGFGHGIVNAMKVRGRRVQSFRVPVTGPFPDSSFPNRTYRSHGISALYGFSKA